MGLGWDWQMQRARLAEALSGGGEMHLKQDEIIVETRTLWKLREKARRLERENDILRAEVERLRSVPYHMEYVEGQPVTPGDPDLGAYVDTLERADKAEAEAERLREALTVLVDDWKRGHAEPAHWNAAREALGRDE